jgi:DNA-binding transcriptional regulator YbjK
MTRRSLIADAAIATIAGEGMRGLTHRAVDRAAGLPEGSTSYYFRTREALLSAALARMAELDTADVGDPPDLGDVDGPATLLTALVRGWVTTSRERTVARYELSLESTRRPELRAKMIEYGSGFRAMAEAMLAAAGASEPRRRGRALVAYVDGLVFDQVVGVGATLDDADLAAACRDMLATALR